MESTSREVRAKIRALKQEISQAETHYSNEINALRQKESQLRNKPMSTGLITPKLAAKQEKKWEEVKNTLSATEKERHDKLEKLKRELNRLKKEYRDNYDEYKKEDKKARDNKIRDIKLFIRHHKVTSAGIIAAVVLLAVVIIFSIKNSYGVACPNDFIGLTVNEATALTEKVGLKSDVWGETYDPEARDEQKVAFVSSIYYPDGSQKYGYNKYNDTNMRLQSGYKVSFEVTDRTAEQQKDVDNCKSNGDNYRFKFENGKVVCYAEATQEEKRAACEVEGKWYRDGQCKSQEDWELHYQWQDAHSACKKYGSNAYAKTLTDCYVGSDYIGPVGDQPASNNSGSSTEGNSENQNTTSESSTPKDDPTQIPEDDVYDAIAACIDTLEQTYGIKAKTHNYSDGYWPGRDYEWIISFRNGNGFSLVTCSYNWKTGSTVIKNIN